MPPRCRVLHVAWRLSIEGGIPVVVRQLARGLDPREFEVHVATVRPAFLEDRLDQLPTGVQVHPAGCEGRLGSLDRLRASLYFSKVAREVRPHVIHAHSGTAVYALLSALRWPRARRLLDVHDAPGNGRHGRLTEWVEGLMCRRFRFRPIVHSTSVAAQVISRWHLDPGRVELIPLGIDTQAYRSPSTDRREVRRRLGLDDDAVPMVLSVARLVPSKNVDLLVDVAAELRRRGVRCRTVVVASGPEKERLQQRLKAMDLAGDVLLVGSLHRDELVDAYVSADVFCSTSNYEGFGLAVAEAMAAGLPVVTTRVGGVTDLVVEGETGHLVPPGRALPLAGRLEGLLTDGGRREAMGLAGQQRAQSRFDITQFIERSRASYLRLPGQGDTKVAVLKSQDYTAHAARDHGRLPYRIDQLTAHGMRLAWTDAHLRPPFSWTPVRVAVRATEQTTAPWLQTALLLPSLVRADVNLAFFESEANTIAVLRRALPAVARAPLVVIACWLAQVLEDLRAESTAGARRKLAAYRWAWSRVDGLICLSRSQVATYEDALGIPSERIHVVPFGIDIEQFSPSTKDDGYVLAVGRDRGRDWPTLFAALREVGLPARVVCRPSDVSGVDIPENVEVLGTVGVDRYRQLLASARVSVIATKQLAYPTGQTVLLESFASAKAVVITDTPAIRDYIEPGHTALTTELGDVDSLAAAIELADRNADLRHALGTAGRQSVEDRFNAGAMWAAVADVMIHVER